MSSLHITCIRLFDNFCQSDNGIGTIWRPSWTLIFKFMTYICICGLLSLLYNTLYSFLYMLYIYGEILFCDNLMVDTDRWHIYKTDFGFTCLNRSLTMLRFHWANPNMSPTCINFAFKLRPLIDFFLLLHLLLTFC